MTHKQNVQVKVTKKAHAPTVVDVVMIVSDDDGKYFINHTEGWSSANEPEPEHRGLVVSVTDNIEVVIPFSQIRRFVEYMDREGV